MRGIVRCLCAIAALSLPLAAGPLVIVENGRGRAAIVVAKDQPQAQRAAAEIQRYIEEMSGAKFPLRTEGEPATGDPAVSLYVGATDAAKEAGVKFPSGFDPTIRPETFGEEGYALRTKGNDIFIGGNSDGPYRGVLYAAYAFLERLGCRWYFPGKWGEIVPTQKTLTVPHLEVESRPDFAVRNIWLSGWVATTPEERALYSQWSNKIGFSAKKEMYPVAGDGFLGMLLPADEYWETHPEFFAMNKKGDRKPRIWRTKKFYDRITMLCMSNPEVFTESVKNLKAAFAGERKMGNVTAMGVGISPPDGAPFCYCKDCLAGSQNFDYPTYVHERMQSEEFFGFANRLAAEFPNKLVATMAYSLRETPPQGVTLRPNVSVTYAPISCCVLHPNTDPSCWRRQEFVSMLKQWRRQTPHVMIYDYNPGFLLGLFVPQRDTANMAVNVPVYKQIGIKGMAREGRKAFMQAWISYYVTAKLLWDAKADVEAIEDEFYPTFFGPAAGPHVRAWWEACEKALVQATNHAHEDWLVNHIYTVEFTSRIHRHVAAALAAKTTDRQRGRVEAFALIADHLEAYAEMEAADRDMDYPRAAAAAGRMIDDQKKLHAIYPFFIDHDKRRAKPRPYFAGGRRLKYLELAAKTNGETGAMAAALPLEMRFRRDRFNEGVIGEWYAPDFNDGQWGRKNTFVVWDMQEPPEDAAGHDYDGYGWYRATIDIPAKFTGKPLRFWGGGAINEAWVWVNGQYAGHKPHKIWWRSPHDFDFDVAKLVRPGEKNTIAIRVWNSAEPGGLYRRGFFWSPNPEEKPE